MRIEHQPATAATQEQLDEWLGSGPDERDQLRAGALPERLQRMLSGSGCVSALGGLLAIAISIGLGATLLILAGRVALKVAHPPQLLGNPYALGVVGALAGALLGLRLSRSLSERGDKLANLSVKSEEIDVEAAEPGTQLPRLATRGGHAFRSVVPIGTLQLAPGKYRAFYVDFAQLPGNAAPSSTPGEPLLLALERLES